MRTAGAALQAEILQGRPSPRSATQPSQPGVCQQRLQVPRPHREPFAGMSTQAQARRDIRHAVGGDEGGAGTPRGSDRPLGAEELAAKDRQRSARVPG